MSILLGKIAIKISRMMGNRGTDVGGRTALRFNKKIFKKLSNNIETIILVTGTNGKSTTTNLIANVLEMCDEKTISNKTGANMYTGILSSMVEAYRFFGDKKVKYGVFEVDEGNVYKVMNELDNNYLVITNFFRDQLDRYSEMDLLIDKIKNSLVDKNVELILNVDDPFCLRFNEFNYVGYGFSNNIKDFEQGSISDSRHCPNCGKELIYSHIFYGQLGHYVCECGFNRTQPKYELEFLKVDEVTINNFPFKHNLRGSYNAYNILAAIASLQEIGISNIDIQKGLNRYKSDDGRMQLIKVNNNNVYLNLVKNHAGMNMTLQEIKGLRPQNVAFILNDYEGDGKDVSWIWDADFEHLLKLDIERFFISGTRANDMALRLKNMGVEPRKIMVNVLFESMVDIICEKDAVVIASYTALNDTKNILMKRGIE
ncbi:UDP-N-acetylmuramyl tripeptide synthase [Bacilli bacterium PM5-9]|nr:UDP-N-acetylmuramyl tripeptide synthase [Bacilli bacterium PM5-9]